MLRILFFLSLVGAAYWMNHKSKIAGADEGRDIEEIVSQENARPPREVVRGKPSTPTLGEAFSQAAEALRQEQRELAPSFSDDEAPPPPAADLAGLNLPAEIEAKLSSDHPDAYTDLLTHFQTIPSGDTEARDSVLKYAAAHLNSENRSLIEPIALRQLEAGSAEHPTRAELELLRSAGDLLQQSANSREEIQQIYKQIESLHPSTEAREELRKVLGIQYGRARSN